MILNFMNDMKKETLYKIIIVILILLNVLQITRHFFRSEPQNAPIKRAIELLNLNDQQARKFKLLANYHRFMMKSLQKKQELQTEKYFKHPNPELLRQIMYIEEIKLNKAVKHFDNIKGLLNKNQYKDFEIFKKMAVKRILIFKPPKMKRQIN